MKYYFNLDGELHQGRVHPAAGKSVPSPPVPQVFKLFFLSVTHFSIYLFIIIYLCFIFGQLFNFFLY